MGRGNAWCAHFTSRIDIREEVAMAKILHALVLCAGVALSAIAPAQEKYSLSIGTGGTGGVYYPLGGGLANILSKNVPGMQATAPETGGAGAKPPMIRPRDGCIFPPP